MVTRLKQLRIENKMTQKQLAEKIGISQQALSKIEQGLRDPSVDNLIQASVIFDVNMEYMMNLTNIPQRINNDTDILEIIKIDKDTYNKVKEFSPKEREALREVIQLYSKIIHK